MTERSSQNGISARTNKQTLVVDPTHRSSLGCIPLNHLCAIQRAGYSSANALLLSPPSVIAYRTRLSLDTVHKCLSIVSKQFTKDDIHDDEMLTTGDEGLDELLNGGLHVGTILDVSGESASGKSTLVAHLTIAVAYAGHSSLLLFTESRAPPISTWTSVLHPNTSCRTLTDRISIVSLADLNVFENLLDFRLPTILSSLSPPPKLIVIDSLSALLRTEFGTGPAELRKRKECLSRVAEALHNVSKRWKLAIVVVNQVADVFDKELSGGPVIQPDEPAPWGEASETPSLDVDHQMPYFDGRTAYSPRIHVALGPIWADHCDARLILARTARKGEDDKLIRRMEIVFSANAKDDGKDFMIDENGLRTLENVTFFKLVCFAGTEWADRLQLGSKQSKLQILQDLHA